MYRQLTLGMLFIILFAFSAVHAAESEQEVDTIKHGRDVTFTVPQGWYLYPRRAEIVLTRDGEILQAISLSRLKYGKNLPNLDRAVFQDTLENEIGEMYIKSFEAERGVSQLERLEFSPVEINGLRGVKLAYRYRLDEGSWMKAQVFAIKSALYLYQVVYKGTERVYYERGAEEFRKLLDSLKIIPEETPAQNLATEATESQTDQG